MKNILLSLWLLLTGYYAYTQKSAIPLAPSTVNRQPSTVHALVVGISDYQHNAIPDLQFADKDAREFAKWLQSKAGGSIPEDNITLLVNNQATNAAVGTALYGMIDVCKPGERFIFYFSGHGDVETKTRNQPGYLLTWDSPANVYMVGALNLRDLQEIVSTLSEKQVQVILITDACHAGKLAGASVGGTQATASAMSKQFANEIKIMSCQPNEFSLEGEQWGDGRGVFSYHLLRGLTGLANRNEDQSVSLTEIDRYLEDKVTTETAPHVQTPMVLGDKQTILSDVDAYSLDTLSGKKESRGEKMLATGSKGLEEEVLAQADEATKARYQAFKTALNEHAFFEPENACANNLYLQLIENETLKPIFGLMARNFAVALLDEVQQAINALLDNDPYEANNWNYHPEKYSRYPEYLQRAIELLGEKHYMYRSLMSKKRYFEGYAIAKTLANHEKEPARRDSLREAAKRLYLEGIQFGPEAAYIYYAIGDMYLNDYPYKTDSLVLWCDQASQLSPGWMTPLLLIYLEYATSQVDFRTAEGWLNRALQIMPNSYNAQDKLGFLRISQGRRNEAFAVAQKMIDQKPELFNAYTIMVFIHYYLDGDYPATEQYAQKSVERNPSPNNWALNFWSGCYANLHPLPEAIEWIRHSMEGSTGVQKGYRGAFLIEALSLAGRYAEAEILFNQLLSENLPPYNQTHILNGMGKMRVRQNRLQEAIAFLDQSLATDPTPDLYFITDFAWLGEVARLQNRADDAEGFFRKALTYSTGDKEEVLNREEAWYLYGNFLLRQNRPDEAAIAFKQSLDIRRKGYWGEYGFALLAAQNGQKQEALDWLQKSLDNFYNDRESILLEPLFKKIRKNKRFKGMMEQRFPSGPKGSN